MATAPAGDASPNEDAMAQLPPLALARPPPPPPEKLDEKWMADRLHQVGHFLDGMADGSLPGGVTFLSRAHNEDTRAEAEKLLMHALKYCKVDSKTKADAIGSPALWAILLAQQAHLSRYRWEVADLPEHWNVHAMHELLRERQGQRVTLEGGSRARRDTRTVGRGLRDAQQLANCSNEDVRMRAIRVDELGNDDDIKTKAEFLHRMLLRSTNYGDDDGLLPQIRDLQLPVLRGQRHAVAQEGRAAERARERDAREA